MRSDFLARLRTVMAVGTVFLAGVAGLGLAQQKKDDPAAKKEDSARGEKVEGVILKVEKVAKAGVGSRDGKADGAGRAKSGHLRLSINTNAVWRDWARDQAQVRDEGSPKADAAKGAKSIATTGQPADENSLVTIEVEPGTRVETRFRSPTDELTKGVKTPQEVKSDEATTSNVRPTGKAVRFRAEDLAPGLFVEADFRTSGDKNTASTITVIRPIEVLNASPKAQASPK